MCSNYWSPCMPQSLCSTREAIARTGHAMPWGVFPACHNQRSLHTAMKMLRSQIRKKQNRNNGNGSQCKEASQPDWDRLLDKMSQFFVYVCFLNISELLGKYDGILELWDLENENVMLRHWDLPYRTRVFIKRQSNTVTHALRYFSGFICLLPQIWLWVWGLKS